MREILEGPKKKSKPHSLDEVHTFRILSHTFNVPGAPLFGLSICALFLPVARRYHGKTLLRSVTTIDIGHEGSVKYNLVFASFFAIFGVYKRFQEKRKS